MLKLEARPFDGDTMPRCAMAANSRRPISDGEHARGCGITALRGCAGGRWPTMSGSGFDGIWAGVGDDRARRDHAMARRDALRPARQPR